MAPGTGLPSGTVTFLFTDIEGSTDLLKRLGRDQYEQVLAEHSGILRAAVAAHDGWVVDTQGDSMFCAFRSARDGISAAVQAQRELESRTWPEHVRVRVRMGLHSGEPKAGEDRYVGIGVHRAARIGAAAHGGQILVSEATRALVADDLPIVVPSLRNLGFHRLKDIDEPERLYQVVASELQDLFPAPRTPRRGRGRRTRLALVVAIMAVAGGAAAGALLATGSASAKQVKLRANSIAVFDPSTGKTVADVQLGFSPADIDAGGDRIWVLDASGRTVTSIDPSTLKILQTVGIDGDPHSQYATGGREWIGVRGGVVEVDDSGATKIPLWKPAPNFGGGSGSSPCFSYVTGDGHSVWVAEGRHLAVLDATTGSVLRRLLLPTASGAALGPTCYGVLYTGGQLLAIRNPDFSIGPVDPSTGSYTPVGKDAYLNTVSSFTSANWAAGFGSYWIGTQKVDTKTGNAVQVLARLDPSSGQVTSQIVVAAGAAIVHVDPASGVWVLGGSPTQGTLVHVDPASNQITRTIRLPHRACCPVGAVGYGVAAGHGRLWVGLDSP